MNDEADKVVQAIEESYCYRFLSSQVDVLVAMETEPADIITALNVLAAEISIWFLYFEGEEKQ